MKRKLSMLLALFTLICIFSAAASAYPMPDYAAALDDDNGPYSLPMPDYAAVLGDDGTPDNTPVITPSPSLAPVVTPSASGANALTAEDLYMAARLIYAEGKNQTDESFLAMACVVYNRYQSKKFPNTIEGIVFQTGQFTVTRNREKFLELIPSERAQNAIQAVFVNGERPLPENVMFFKSARLKKAWGKRVYYATIGANMYYS